MFEAVQIAGSAAGEGLQDVQCLIVGDPVRQRSAIADRSTTNEERDVPAESALLIHHVSTDLRMPREVRIKHRASGGARGVLGRRVDVAGENRGDTDDRYGVVSDRARGRTPVCTEDGAGERYEDVAPPATGRGRAAVNARVHSVPHASVPRPFDGRRADTRCPW